MTEPGTILDDRLDVGGAHVRELVWGRPLASVTIRKWVTFTVFTLTVLAIAARLPVADPLERYVLAPVLLIAALFAVLSLFIVRGSAAIRRRDGLRRLAEALVEHGVIGDDDVPAFRTPSSFDHQPDGSWSIAVPVVRQGVLHLLAVDGDASDLARVRLATT